MLTFAYQDLDNIESVVGNYQSRRLCRALLFIDGLFDVIAEDARTSIISIAVTNKHGPSRRRLDIICGSCPCTQANLSKHSVQGLQGGKCSDVIVCSGYVRTDPPSISKAFLTSSRTRVIITFVEITLLVLATIKS